MLTCSLIESLSIFLKALGWKERMISEHSIQEWPCGLESELKISGMVPKWGDYMSFIILFNFDPSFNHWFDFYATKLDRHSLISNFIENKLSIFSIESSLMAMGSNCMFILNWIWGLIHFKLDLMACSFQIGSDTSL